MNYFYKFMLSQSNAPGQQSSSPETNYYSKLHCLLGSIKSSMVVLKPQGPRFDPGLVNYVYRTMLANNLGSWCEVKHKRKIQNNMLIGKQINKN